jgi:Alpha/beta hydrolase domain
MEERNLLRHPSCVVALGLLSLVGITAAAEARITSVVVTTKTSPAFGGSMFGSVGQYEQLDGTASGEIDPKDPLNAVIQDIELAPRNSRGMVEYSMDISILKPINTNLGNHTIIYDVVNRGNKSSPSLNIGVTATKPQGDGFLESEGYTLVWSGWEGDITTGIKINLPVAKNKNGSEITGNVRAEYILGAPANTVDVTAQPAYAAVSTSNAGATLTMRVHQNDPKVAIDNSQWAFADCSTVSFPGTPSTTKVCLNGGFDTNHIYELVYTAQNPTVAGIGFAATRDFVSFLRGGNGNHDHGKKRSTAGPAPTNPLDSSVDHAIIYGSSQSGRWIRTFLELGFNEGEDHERVVEGAIRTKRRTAAPSISASPSRRGCREPSTPKSNSRVRNHHRPGVIPPTRLLGSLPGSSIAVGSRTPARKSRRPRPTPSIGRP